MTKKLDLLQNRLRKGSVILFFSRSGKVRLGEVLVEANTGQDELQVQDAGGARSRVKFRDILLNLGQSSGGFAAKQQHIENLATEIDLALLVDSHPEWQKGPGVAVNAMAEEYFGPQVEAQQEAAMYLALQRDNRFTISGEKAQFRLSPPTKNKRREKDRQKLFESLRAAMTEALQKDWGEAEINAHPLGKKLARLARATLEQRRLYPEAWRKDFVMHLHSLNTLTGYRDARHLLFHWLQKIGHVPPDADLFIFSEPVLRRHARRLQSFPDGRSQQQTTSSQHQAPSIQHPASSIQHQAFIVTIDNPETTDRDDALSFRRTANGIEIGVHTPLLEALVPRGTLFDEWAYDVGASAYLPHRRVPMLPEKIASDLGSLNAGQERPALSFYFELRDTQPPRFSRVVCEHIKIGMNSDYESVDKLLPEASWEKLMQAEKKFVNPESDGIKAALQTWANAAVQLGAQRLANGARIFKRDEVDVRVDAGGIVHLRFVSRDSVAHKMVAEWMIATNQAAAQFCHENNLPCIYRVQETLAPEREDEEPAGRTHARAQLKPERAPHRDLGVDGYTQITSPLRRYSDLVMQRQIVAFLQTGKPQYSQTDLWARALAIEEMTRRIQRLESRADFYWKCVYLSQHLGETYTAQIGRSHGHSPRIILQLVDLDLRLFVPPSGIEGIEEKKIPPHHSPAEVQAVCLEMNADKAIMRFQII
ncbi:MAG: ribonuclease catalytic domain-containing protein [candidate division KSB1 bacterium]|nr:ribonuclease catalytic domain-containing protein [candidate division KSB1 bacterium]MDZ7365494.1 ribonuclease catalytic domain-containing protein [candidate division KSB1 bacterium]MDZ7403597.1 ribonuclease catalytic domain-containing protein [candidate division KSB1 bacterium]